MMFNWKLGNLFIAIYIAILELSATEEEHNTVEEQIKERPQVSQFLSKPLKILKCEFHEESRLCTKKRCKRFEFYTKKWPKEEISYRIDNFPSNSDISNNDIPRLFKEAFQLWSDVAPLVFREVSRNEASDTVITFKKGEHGDDVQFDGPRGTLAHAYHLMGGYGDTNGDIHFDNDEYWTWKSKKGTKQNKINLFIVAAHEMGHVIGLAHSKVPTALMWENYQEFEDGYKLSDDDVKGIQHLYGKKTKTTPSKTNEKVSVTKNLETYDKKTDGYKHEKRNKTEPDQKKNQKKNRLKTNKCDWSLDGVTPYRGEIMIFKGNRIWRVKEDGTLISSDNGELASSYWYRLPADIEAVYHRQSDNALAFVKGRYLYTYKGPHQYPLIETRPLQDQIPYGVDAAISVSDKDHEGVYFFKNKLVWKMNPSTYKSDIDYPKKISNVWKKLPRNINAAYYHNGYLHFFRNGRVFRSKLGKDHVYRYKRPFWKTIYRFTKKC